ncbi:uncharacterized protein N7479_005284 [Penicillium vulpinum]|uniref:Uncharacterized protein n=1 Tax=Penicillium vulpinum TaxID=29845 RepID=A0A1V6RIF7_9EURO|nr:uncharacterized protein N7479_005284 [Penicillium vulpinum]KAJ5958134.1 hypothetical protein N7479_005284 [Penicillium vulpinum]OQE01264.1 hypothetical protein PENVUL_c043G02782 [Penicillium vulpinum]
MHEIPNYPQNLLDRVKAAKHGPSLDSNAKYVFHVIHRNDDEDMQAFEEVDSEDEEMDAEDDDTERQSTFDTLEEANNAALALFRSMYMDFFDQENDMSNWYEEGTSEEQLNEVVWKVNADGEVSLKAHETEDEIIYEIYVSASKV